MNNEEKNKPLYCKACKWCGTERKVTSWDDEDAPICPACGEAIQ
jgi:predicted nucleic acid-binding Zn ribbon protein